MSDEPEKKAFQDPDKVRLTNGEEIVLPRLTIGKILALTDGMDELLTTAKEKAPGVFDLFSGGGEEKSTSDLVKTLPQLIPLLLNQIVKVLAVYLGKDKVWVEDNMDMEDLVAVATPFFGAITKQANHVLGPLNSMFKKVSPESTNPSTPPSQE